MSHFRLHSSRAAATALARMPGARYSGQDEAQERALCAIDFHQPTHALCPKLFSTSPGTLVYDLRAGPYAGRLADFEREVCSQGHVVTSEAVGGAIRQGLPQGQASHTIPAEVLTELGDNDAGVRLSYANFTQRTGMLERVRHYHPHTYRQLMLLEADFAAAGPLHAHVRSTFGGIATNINTASAILRTSCKAGHLRFDADPESYLRDGQVEAGSVDCDNP